MKVLLVGGPKSGQMVDIDVYHRRSIIIPSEIQVNYEVNDGNKQVTNETFKEHLYIREVLPRVLDTHQHIYRYHELTIPEMMVELSKLAEARGLKLRDY